MNTAMKLNRTRLCMRQVVLFLSLLLLLLPLSAYADPSPAVQKVGKDAAAAHLCTHIGAFTDGITEYYEMYNRDGEHLYCSGSRVSLWDSPQKGDNVGSLYPGSKLGTLEKNSEFELVKVERFKGRNYANVRIYKDGAIFLVGWVSADYIACKCSDYSEVEEVPEYIPISLTYSLR